MRAAVTGGAGFVGGALIKLLSDEGYSVAALIRDPSKVSFGENVDVVKGDLDDLDALDKVAAGADFFIHLAGVTFPKHDGLYQTVNVDGAANAARTAVKAGAKFVHISSMSARMPSVSPYACSKHNSEQIVAETCGDHDWLALRLPAIYGPGDHATLPFFKLVKAGFALAPRTNPPARASLLYVEDAARALLAAARSPIENAVYEVGDETPEGREWREIGETLGNIMNKKVIAISVPRPVVSMFHNISRMAGALSSKKPDIRRDQANEFFHPDWAARENLLSDATDWRAETTLEAGFMKTAHWYRENGLL